MASGVLSTVQELGGVIASAAVGALLQDRLEAALRARAVQAAAQLPAGTRGQFVQGFNQAAKSGFQVGRGQTGGSVPANLPASTVHQVSQLAHDVFTHAFVDAMRPTLILPIAIVAVAAVGCLAVRQAQPSAGSDWSAERQEEGPSVRAGIKLVRVTQRLAREKGREPSVDELAADEVRSLVEATKGPMTFRPAGRSGAN